MTYITRDGKVYKQTIIEEEVDVAQEEYKLSAWRSALENDARELQEYHAKIAEIDALKISDDFKTKLKQSVSPATNSGIRPEMVIDHEEKMAAISNAVEILDGDII